MGDQDVTLTSTTDTAAQVAAALGATAPDTAAAEKTVVEDKKADAVVADTQVATESDAAVVAVADAAAGDTATKVEPTEDEKAKIAAKKVAAATGGKEKGKLSKRIDELVKERNEARGELSATKTEVDALRKRVEEIIAGKAEKKADDDVDAGKTTQTPPKPKSEDFPDYDAYLDARDQWLADRTKEASKSEVDAAVKQALKQRDDQTKTVAQQQAQEEARERYSKSVESAMTRYDDFEEVVNQPTKLTHVMYDGMLDSEIGGDIAYYLSTNDDARKKLFALGETARAVKEFGKIEAIVEAEIKKRDEALKAQVATTDTADDVDEEEVEEAAEDQAEVAERRTTKEVVKEATPPKKVATKAPDPMPKTKGGASAVSSVPADQLSFNEYKERRMRELKAAGKRL